MPRRSATVTIQSGEQADRNRIEEEKDLLEALRGLGESDVILKIYKYERFPIKPGWVDDVELSVVQNATLERYLKDNWGSGSYQVRGCVAGKWVKGYSRIVHILASPAEQQHAGENGNGKKNGADDGDLWKFMLTNQRDSADKMIAMIQAQSTTMMQAIATIMAAQRPMDLGGIAAIMGQLKPPAPTEGTKITEVIQVVKDLNEIGLIGSGGGGAEPADPMMKMIETGLNLVATRAPAADAARAVTAGAAPPTVTTAAPVPNPPAQQQENLEAMLMRERAEFLTKLKQKAAAGRSVEEWADYIEENQDERVCAWLLTTVRSYPFEVIWSHLIGFDADLNQPTYQQWFASLYNELTAPPTDTPPEVVS